MAVRKNRLMRKTKVQDLRSDFHAAGLAAKKPWEWTDEELIMALNGLDCVIEFMNGMGERGIAYAGLVMKRESLCGFAHARKII